MPNINVLDLETQALIRRVVEEEGQVSKPTKRRQPMSTTGTTVKLTPEQVEKVAEALAFTVRNGDTSMITMSLAVRFDKLDKYNKEKHE